MITNRLLSYGIFIFIVNTILFASNFPHIVSQIIFYLLMFFYSIIILINLDKFNFIVFNKAFLILLVISSLNLLHLIFFDQNFGSLLYFITKVILFYMICLGVVYNYTYFTEEFFKKLSIIGVLIVLFSIVFNPSLSNNYSGVFLSRNDFGIILSTIFGIFYISKKEFTFKDYIFLITLIFFVLISASRNALVGIILAMIIKDKISIKLVLYIIFFSIIFFILNTLNFETSISRLASEVDVLHNRNLEFYYSYETFKSKWLTGYGLDHYAYINQELVPNYLKQMGVIIMAHNSYLAALTQYGLPFAVLIFVLIFINVCYITYYFFKNKFIKNYAPFKVYFYLMMYVLITSISESHLFGINTLHSILFWFSLAFLNYTILYRVTIFNNLKGMTYGV